MLNAKGILPCYQFSNSYGVGEKNTGQKGLEFPTLLEKVLHTELLDRVLFEQSSLLKSLA